MFKTIRENFRIEQAFSLCEEQLGMYPRNMWKKMAGGQQAAARKGLREMQDAGLGVHDLAVMLVAPYIGVTNETERKHVVATVSLWKSHGMVEPHVFEHLMEQVETSTDDWVSDVLSGVDSAGAAGSSHASAGASQDPYATSFTLMEDKATKEVASFLRPDAETILAELQVKVLPAEARDSFSLGYLFGFIGGVVRDTELNFQAGCSVVGNRVFPKVFQEDDQHDADMYILALRHQAGVSLREGDVVQLFKAGKLAGQDDYRRRRGEHRPGRSIWVDHVLGSQD